MYRCLHCCYVNFYVNIKIHCVFFSSLDFIYTFCKTHLCDSFICSCTYDLEYFCLSLPVQYTICHKSFSWTCEFGAQYVRACRTGSSSHKTFVVCFFLFLHSLFLYVCIHFQTKRIFTPTHIYRVS